MQKNFRQTGTVNYPNEQAYTRITDFKYLTGQVHPKTAIVYEYPKGRGDPYYPVPRPENATLYKKYQQLAMATPNTFFAGRLATYKYYNMDQVVAQSLNAIQKNNANGIQCTCQRRKNIMNNNLEFWGGIECTINRVNDSYFDQLHLSGHYMREGDIKLISELGIKTLRYPVLWEKYQPHYHHPIDWAFADKIFGELNKFGITPIAGLLHHGSGPRYTNLLDENFPGLFASYAAQGCTQDFRGCNIIPLSMSPSPLHVLAGCMVFGTRISPMM